MMLSDETLWAVVYVWRGIPERFELFLTEKHARGREREIRRKLAPEDEVRVLEMDSPLATTR